jgi:hypothetical protein
LKPVRPSAAIKRRDTLHSTVLVFTVALFLLQSASVRVVRVVLDANRSESPAFEGKEFGSGIRHEKIAGEICGKLDPKDRRNAIIQDISLALLNARGKVEYVATFTLLKPIDMSKWCRDCPEALQRGRYLPLERMAGGYRRGRASRGGSHSFRERQRRREGNRTETLCGFSVSRW